MHRLQRLAGDLVGLGNVPRAEQRLGLRPGRIGLQFGKRRRHGVGLERQVRRSLRIETTRHVAAEIDQRTAVRGDSGRSRSRSDPRTRSDL